ncbi:cell wall-binding repeat-containing protein [Paenisporosarcina antarctica]|uniref:Bacterial Ig domain-containing protein n=1 Tax=Paenisporosarcina antarctica TaxID=417367 RepID=A0A4P6ZZL2_9BACL|nr:cell wall-binding repeat-containing protein [Paenisporosarcina antarctica]QBP41927.1 hypothetical protein E2636_12540 [Paenisporosarcina antarctica]
MKKGFVSIVAMGVLVSLLSVSSTAHAEEQNYELFKKSINLQIEKPLLKGVIDPFKLKHLELELKSSTSLEHISKLNKSAASEETLVEKEPNDDFSTANILPNDRVMVGQLLPLFDVDIFKVNVPAKGVLLVAGTANSYAIELAFAAFEKDFDENGFLEYLGFYYEDDVEMQAYQVHKAGTYYIGAIDSDNEDGYDDNYEDDLYGIVTSFEDNVEPSMPSVNEVTASSTSVTGTAEVGSKITVKVGTTVLGTAVTNKEGKYMVSIVKQKEGTALHVTATDSAGNISEASEVKVREGNTVNRISGTNRITTAIAISKNGWKTAKTVVLALGYDFPDALAASPLAYQQDAPILLTNQKKLAPETFEELKRLNAQNVIIIGGELAVSSSIANSIKSMGIKVERISGKNRFETAAKIAVRMGGNPEKAIVTDGYNFPDALAISSYAAQNEYPILLTKTNLLPAETQTVLKSIPKTIVMGGELAVSSTVFNKLKSPVRISGKSRFETAVAVIDTLNLQTEKVYVATGEAFADALTGSVLAAKNNAPIILVRKSVVPVPTADLIKRYNIRNFTLLGGEMAISKNLIE